MSRPSILIAGGGTGGHVFPGLAVADAIAELAEVDVTFVGTSRGIETRVIPSRGYPLELLDVAPMKGGGFARAARGAAIAARATVTATALVRKLSPRVVLSVGGYASGPISLAAGLMGIPIAVLEPNSSMGLANRLLAPIASRGYVAWREVIERFRGGRARNYGVPLRAGFVPTKNERSNRAPRLLVMGGSQGAQALNERMPLAVLSLQKSIPDLEVTHQSGRDRDEAVRAAYAREGLNNVRVLPFLDDVASAIAKADLVVARAGAVTVAEIAAIGRAAIFVPFPHAADDHQAKNAMSLAEKGGAICVRQEAADDQRIAREAVRVLSNESIQTKLEGAARAHGKPNAARDVARDLIALAGIDEVRAPNSGDRRKGSSSRGSGSIAQQAEAE